MSVVMLAGRCESSWIVANALKDTVPLRTILVEEPVSRWHLMKRRAARIGWWSVAGQILFSFYVRRLRREARVRAAEILQEADLNPVRPKGIEILDVASANDDRTIAILRELAPRVVVVNGTRILSRRLLESTSAVFLNMHAGITPRYRGVHGGYWALANRDRENAGVTVHLVNTGIDTGGIVYQHRILPTDRDNFTTYPLLQVAAGVRLMKRAVLDALAGTLEIQEAVLPSKLYHLPTLWQY